MATKPLTSQVFRSILSSGKPNSLGTVDVYVAGTAFATHATIYSDEVKTAELTNPVTLSSAGEIEIWVEDNVSVDYVVKDSGGNTIRNILAVPSTAPAVATGNYNLLTNGSAELDTDTLPDDWTLSTETSGTITVATDSVAHGQKSFKFVGAGNGSGIATSEKFDVLEAKIINVAFTYKTDAATSTNSVKIKWYTKADALVSTTTVYSGTTGQPSAFTTYYRGVAAPATAVRAELVLGGVENGGTVETGTTYFDNVTISQAEAYAVDSVGNPIIYDTNGNEIVRTTAVASAVNEINVKNSITGNAPSIEAEGDDTNIGFDILSKGVETVNVNNAVKATNVASDVNEVTVTSSVTTSAPSIAATGTDTNIDLDINSKGTGTVNVNGTPVYGYVILDTPELISSTLTEDAWTTINNTTLNTAQAKAAVLRAELNSSTVAGTNVNVFFYLRKTGSGLTTGAGTQIAGATNELSSSGNLIAYTAGEATVNLDSSYDFDYYYSVTGDGTLNEASSLYLVGYYA